MTSRQEKPNRAVRNLTRIAALWGMALVGVLLGAPGNAAAAPVYDVKAVWGDTNLPPGGEAEFEIWVRNVGDAAGSQNLFIRDELPEGVVARDIDFFVFGEDYGEEFCFGAGTEAVECFFPGFFLSFFLPPPGSKPSLEGVQPSGYFLGSVDIEVDIAPGASGTATNIATVAGGGAASDSDVDEVSFGTPSQFGLVPGSFEADLFGEAFPSEELSRQAADHPFEQRVNFDFSMEMIPDYAFYGGLHNYVNGTIKTVEVTLPRGMVGNPEATPKCDPFVFAEEGSTPSSTACSPETQVGYLNIPTTSRTCCARGGLNRVAIYNLEPPHGVPADFAFKAGGLVQGHIYPVLDPAQNYAIKTVTPHISSIVPVAGTEVVFWGVPGDPIHDKFRYFTELVGGKALGASFGATAIRPVLTNPMDCGFDNGGARIRIDSYSDPGNFTPVEEYSDPLNVEGCDDPRFRFEPDVALQPTSRDAGGPTGLDVHLEVRLRDDAVADADELYAQNEDVQGIATPPMKRAVVTFPEGMTISPSAAQGLTNCSPAQIGLGTNDPVTCPDSSQFGTLTLHTPILPVDEQPTGQIYIAKQGDNPFHNFLSLYLVIQEPDRGILVKIPGRVDLDPETGQITTTFDDLPQFPVSDMQMTFKGGVRAALVNPATCGRKTIEATFYSWHDPQTPHRVDSFYDITQKPDGSPCVNSLAERPFNPDLAAGTLNNAAGSYSPFIFRLTRTDDDQEFSQLGVSMPPGLIGKLAGVAECPEAGIAQAIGRVGAGDGALERANPSCPASSEIGTTEVGTGVGVPLTYVPGKAYLAGPYRGAPLSMVVITPTVVGPYDLGVIAVRAALHVDPETTQVSVASDPFPLIYQGIPVRIRDIRVNVDRPEFTLNPTNCAAMAVGARVTGTGGDLNSTADDTAVDLANRFQAADCASLGFNPKLNMRLFGGTKRGAHPKLRAVVRMPAGGANMARAAVALPRSEFLDQAHIRTVCTRVQFAQDACPRGSIYGHAKAKSPLLDEVVSGPIYLRSSANKLPDLVFALKGRVDVNVVGRVDSVRGGIRNTFELIPDVPVSWAVLTFQGGRKGLLINSRDLCKGAARATARFRGQNGRTRTLRPKMRNACGKGKKRRARRSKHGR